jgi:tripartite-type tricarboxylate transporter receptor subunit TctC
MTAVSRTRRGLLACALATFGLLASPPGARAQGTYPEKPIRVIVPSAAGGSTDLVARILQLTLERIKGLPQPLAVVNNAAAGGVVGTRTIRDAEPDGYTIGVWHMGLLTAPAMGVVDYDHTAFESVAQVGRIQVGLGVREDSRFRSAKDLIEAAKAQPNTVTVATNIGLLPHFVPLMLANEAGVSFRFVQAGGGALRLKSLLGAHTEVTLFSLSELITFKASGVRPLVLFTDKRNPAAPDIPAVTEAGYRTAFDERILVLAPKGTPADRVKVLADAFRAAMDDPDLVKRFGEQGIERAFLTGPALRTALDEANAQVRAVAEEVKRQQQAEPK